MVARGSNSPTTIPDAEVDGVPGQSTSAVEPQCPGGCPGRDLISVLTPCPGAGWIPRSDIGAYMFVVVLLFGIDEEPPS